MNEKGDDKHSALFATLILQQSNMALMMLGKVPDPATSKTEVDLAKAALFIDMLAMLEAKTRGNLSGDEAKMLKQTLSDLRMAYVEASQAAAEKTAPAQASSESASEPPPSPSPAQAGPTEEGDPGPASGVDPGPSSPDPSRKRFSKKY